jgi:hypothetical protein
MEKMRDEAEQIVRVTGLTPDEVRNLDCVREK